MGTYGGGEGFFRGFFSIFQFFEPSTMKSSSSSRAPRGGATRCIINLMDVAIDTIVKERVKTTTIIQSGKAPF